MPSPLNRSTLSLWYRCDTFWRESHSRREDIRTPARSILARAFGHQLCRKRLRIVERTKRLAGLFEQMVTLTLALGPRPYSSLCLRVTQLTGLFEQMVAPTLTLALNLTLNLALTLPLPLTLT